MIDINTLPIPSSYRWLAGKIVDNFAGGGGASTGIAQAIGKSPDIAVNHNVEALMMHEENHPETKHYNESVWDINIKKALNDEPVLAGWFSPDCTHFSVAKGGKPVKKVIRGLAWIVKKWVGQSDMAVVFMENVKEFTTWGPLIAKRCKLTKRVIKLVADPVKKDKKGDPVMNEVVSEPGEYVPYREQALVPDKKRAGKTFKQFVAQLREAGYNVEWQVKGLTASDFGEPTTRNRFFLIARKDGLPIVWPKPTHGSKKLVRANPGKLQPWATAGENLDWSIVCPSIFDRKKPLAEKTMARIFKGIQKFVIDAGDDAFLVKTNHGGEQFRGQSLNDPMATITSKHGTGLAAVSLTKFNQNSIGQSVDQPIDTVMAGATRFGTVAAHLIPTGYGEREGQTPRTHDLQEPLPTLVGTNKFAVIEAQLQSAAAREVFKVGSIMTNTTGHPGRAADEPLPTITTAGNQFAVETHLEPVQGGFITTIDHGGARSAPTSGLDEPISTMTLKARHIKVAALLKHYTGVVGQSLELPLPTITATDHNSVMDCTLEAAHIQRDFGNSVGHAADEPLGAIMPGGGGKSAVIASSLVKMRGSCAHGQSLDRPLDTITGQGNNFAQVQAFLIKYYGTGGAVSVEEPLDAITSKARFGLVTIHGQDYQIVDIGMRMLEPHELYRCQGFPEGYKHQVVMGKKLAKHAQVRMVGNSVPPGLARVLVQANIPRWALEAA